MTFSDIFKNKERTNNLNHFGALVNLAFVDGEFSTEEYELLESFASKLQLTKNERDIIIDAPEKFTVKAIHPIAKRMAYVYDFFKMIYADHRLDENEYELVLNYVQKLGFGLVETKRIVNCSVEIFENTVSQEDFEILVLKA